MTRTPLHKIPMLAALFALFAMFTAQAQATPAADDTRFISDQITLSVRERPDNSAGTVGVVRSGNQVRVLEVLGPDSFARIKTADGREGWIATRYLSEEPIAKDQVLPLKKQLSDAGAQVQSLQRELAQAKTQLEQAAPSLALADENQKLRVTMADVERSSASVQLRYDEESAKRKTLLLGAGLAGAGVLFGLLLPYLGRGKRRRYSDF